MTLTIAPVDGQILKRDSVGRVKTPRERRQAILEEFDKSGMSGQKFAKWAGIKYTTFANWLQQRRKQRSKEAAASGSASAGVQWVEALVTKSARGRNGFKAETIIIHAEGLRVELGDAKQVGVAVAFLREWQRRC